MVCYTNTSLFASIVKKSLLDLYGIQVFPDMSAKITCVLLYLKCTASRASASPCARRPS